MQDKYNELRNEYNKVIQVISRFNDEFDKKEIERFLVTLSLRIWSANKKMSEDYSSALFSLTGKEYISSQIMTAMSCAGDLSRNVRIPASLKKMNMFHLEYILDAIGNFLITVALINGDFTMDEASRWNEIMTFLKDRLHRGYYFAVDPYDHVTEPNEESYVSQIFDDESKEVNHSTEEIINETKESLNNLKSSLENSLANTESSKDTKEDFVIKSEPNDEQSLSSLLEELNSLVGLETVKKDVHSLLNFIKIAKLRKAKGMKVPAISYHLVFTGNPGTGKTTIARLIAQLYYKMGLLSSGQLIETDRSALVAGYLGQTAIKTQKVIQSAIGGVLFIDEAYSLAKEDQDSYGQEAIETLLKAMEDHRDELVVIVAGYDELMHRFIESNPGLRSRFNKYFHFPDYTGEELASIFERFCTTNGYTIDGKSKNYLNDEFTKLYENRNVNFGNARTVRNVFENAIRYQADRLASNFSVSERELAELTYDDILPALKEEIA